MSNQPREFWMNNTKEKVDGQMAYKERYGCGLDAFKVIEKAAYDELMQDARKLRNQLGKYHEFVPLSKDSYVCNCEACITIKAFDAKYPLTTKEGE